MFHPRDCLSRYFDPEKSVPLSPSFRPFSRWNVSTLSLPFTVSFIDPASEHLSHSFSLVFIHFENLSRALCNEANFLNFCVIKVLEFCFLGIIVKCREKDVLTFYS